MSTTTTTTTKATNDGDCCCVEFSSSLKSIHLALQDKDKTTRLIQWLSTDPCRESVSDGRFCGAKNCFDKRGKTSLLILNGIRDACRPFLEHQGSSTAHKISQGSPAPSVPYEEAFPTLASGAKETDDQNNNQQHDNKKKKPKRRIRPAIVQAQPSAWGGSTDNAKTKPTGNLVDLPDASAEPLAWPIKNTNIRPTTPSAWASNPTTTMSTNGTKESVTTLTPTKKPGNSSNVKEQTPSITSSSFITPQKSKAVTPFKVSTDSKQSLETNKELARSKEIQHLIDVYVTLLIACLVPSTALELHLLIRLLSIPVSSSNTAAGDFTTIPLAQTLSNPHRCQYFGAQALSRFEPIIQTLGRTLIDDIIRCPAVRLHCPDLVKHLEITVQQDSSSKVLGPSSPSRGLTSNTQTAILTQPFDKNRDSRHNYRTRDQQAMYKNREETRDAFLYQLRSFLNVRGKIVNTAQSDKSIEKLRTAARSVVDGVLDSNLPWFADFFCDMLLQIGLIPPEETDRDLLKIADKTKLQKLHRRFSEKSNQTNRSTRRLTATPKTDDSSSSPTSEAIRIFPGHQEFFFLFLLSADSYRLAVHLQPKLASTLKKLQDEASQNEIEKNLAELCLLGRFLGLLLFYPNWKSFSADKDFSKAKSRCGFHLLYNLGLPLLDVVTRSWQTGRLIVTVPWIVDMLKLCVWDKTSLMASDLTNLTIKLRQIQLCLQNTTSRTDSINLVGFCIETFFGEVVGVARIPGQTKLKPDVASGNEFAGGLDSVDLHFTQNTVYAANQHLEELKNLMSDLSRKATNSIRSPGVSRKLRPSVLSTSPTASDFRKNTESTSLFSSDAVDSQEEPIVRKLRDTFFHQHHDLRSVCEFVGDRALKASLNRVGGHARSLRVDARDANRQEGIISCQQFVKESLKSTIRASLDLLASNNPNSAVLDTATTLTVNHLLKSGESTIRSTIISSLDATATSVPESTGQQLFAGEQSSSQSDWSIATSLLESIRELMSSGDQVDGDAMAADLIALLETLERLSSQIGHGSPLEDDVRSFFRSVLLLDVCARPFVESATVDREMLSVESRWSIVSNLVLVTMTLTCVSKHGLRSISHWLSEDGSIRLLVDLGLEACDITTLSSLLVKCVEEGNVKCAALAKVLLERPSSPLSQELSTTCIKLCQESPLIGNHMGRLQSLAGKERKIEEKIHS